MMDRYAVYTKFEDEENFCLMSRKELAELWETDQIAGIYTDIRAFSYDSEAGFTPVDVSKLANEYLEERKAIQDEYEEYCETVNEYGYGYYENQDMLEMGFNPYTGSYDDDC